MKKATKTTAFLSALCLSATMFSALPANAAGVTGDVDGDGVLTGHDAAVVSRYLHEGDVTLSEEQQKIADVDGNGKIEQTDADWLYENRQCNLGVSSLSKNLSVEISIGDAYWAMMLDSVKATFPDAESVPKEYQWLLEPTVQNILDFNGNGTTNLTDCYLILVTDSNRAVELESWDVIFQNGRYYIDFSDPRSSELSPNGSDMRVDGESHPNNDLDNVHITF